MEKIFFGNLTLEITRRCQLQCTHCMRGDAQEVDMSKEIIDSILDQTAGIFEVFFTGGEPTLNVDGMDYFLREVMRRNIPLGGLSFITNGVSIPDTLKAFLLDAYDYITNCRTNCKAFWTDAAIAEYYRVRIEISSDEYHIGTNPATAKEVYESILPYEGCFVDYYGIDRITREGRAKNIENSISNSFLHTYPKVQIGIAYQGCTPICSDSIRIEKMLDFCDAYVPCRLIVTAKGKINPIIWVQSNYQAEDETITGICQYKDGKMPSIIESILSYNFGALPCYVGYYIPWHIETSEISYFMNTKQQKSTGKAPYFDPIFSSDRREIQNLISASEQEYLKAHLKYYADRVPKYFDKKEFSRDFPYSNDYFYQKLIQTINNTDAQTAAQWIIDNTSYPWYRVDDGLVPMVKSMYKQCVIQKVRKDNNGLWNQLFSKVISYEFEQIPYLNE